jgi:DNA-binding LacI/PurR family transcriptional regulator
VKEKRQRIRLADVAERAKVSLTTTSHALNDIPDARVSSATRARLREAARELGYQPNAVARSLAVGKTDIVGFAISGFVSPLFATPFFSEMIRSAGHGLEPSGYNLLLIHPRPGEEAEQLYRQTVGTGLIDGALLEGNFIKDELVLRLDDEGFPYVLVGRELPQREVTFVTLDYSGASYQATRHLMQLGHRSIGFIGGPRVQTMTNIVDRERGYRLALAERGGRPGGAMVVHGDDISREAPRKLPGAVRLGILEASRICYD